MIEVEEENFLDLTTADGVELLDYIQERCASKLAEKGITNTAVYDVSNTHVSYLIAESFKYSHIVLATADIDGDWREEIITSLNGEIRVYRTCIPAADRRVTLMQDPLYRSYIMHMSMGYPQSPVPSFYLGE